jgi:hypothetical protein
MTYFTHFSHLLLSTVSATISVLKLLDPYDICHVRGRVALIVRSSREEEADDITVKTNNVLV